MRSGRIGTADSPAALGWSRIELQQSNPERQAPCSGRQSTIGFLSFIFQVRDILAAVEADCLARARDC